MLDNNATKYLFNTSFDVVTKDKGPSALELEYQRGFEEGKIEGHTEGYTESMDAVELQICNILQTVGDELTHVFQNFDSLVEANTKYSIDLIHKIAQKLFLDSPSNMLIEQAVRTLQEALPLVIEHRHLMMYINPDLVEPMRNRLSQDQEFSELARRLEIVGNDLFTGSECKIAWGKGALEVSPTATWDKINTIIDNFKTLHPTETMPETEQNKPEDSESIVQADDMTESVEDEDLSEEPLKQEEKAEETPDSDSTDEKPNTDNEEKI